MVKKWKLLKSEEVFKTPFVTILREELQRPDGKIISDFYAAKRRDAVFVCALTSDQQVPVVHQYKNGVKDLIYELPAGFVDEGEVPQTAAKRELEEETGFSCANYELLGTFAPNPSFAENQNYVYLGLNAVKNKEQRLDGNEDIDVELFSLKKLVSDIKKKESIFIDTTSQLALLLTWEKFKQ